jgi:hypothetical protein
MVKTQRILQPSLPSTLDKEKIDYALAAVHVIPSKTGAWYVHTMGPKTTGRKRFSSKHAAVTFAETLVKQGYSGVLMHKKPVTLRVGPTSRNIVYQVVYE